MSRWPSEKAGKVLRALLRAGWQVKRSSGSHKILEHPDPDRADFVWSFHSGIEIGPRMLSRIGKRTGLRPKDL